MSANHQRMTSQEYLEKTEELNRLKHGDDRALRLAEEQAREALARMKRESDAVYQGISKQRRRLLEQLSDIENETIATLRDVSRSTEQVRQRMGQLSDRIKDATASIDELMESTRAAFTTAVAMYQQAKEELTASRLDPDYERFATEELRSIETQINALEGRDLSGPAMQASVQMIMTDLYHMDVIVSGKRVAFIQDQAEALELAATLLTKADNVRKNNHEVLDDATSPLMDMDFWTDGCFGEMEAELRKIQQRLYDGQRDASYSHKQLKADLKRLHELEQIEDMLVVGARSKINLSYFRREQGDLIQEILESDHRYTLISKGFAKGGDEREAFILRMKRHTDGAQVEVIINPGNTDGEADVYFRVDSTTYMDSATMASITQAIADELQENGIDMTQYRACHPEQMPQYQPEDPLNISEQARKYHGIAQRQPMSIPLPS